MQSLLNKTLRIALVAFVAGIAGAAGNAVGTRYVTPLIESKLPSRVSRESEQDTPPVPGTAGYPAR